MEHCLEYTQKNELLFSFTALLSDSPTTPVADNTMAEQKGPMPIGLVNLVFPTRPRV